MVKNVNRTARLQWKVDTIKKCIYLQCSYSAAQNDRLSSAQTHKSMSFTWIVWSTLYVQGDPYVSERFFKNGCGIKMSQATPTKFSMLFKHNYRKLFWKFGDHSFNFSFVHGPSWSRVLESLHRNGVIFTFCKKSSKGHCEAMVDVKKIYFTDF